MEGGSMFIGDKGIIVCSTYGGEVMMFPEERFQEFKDLQPPCHGLLEHTNKTGLTASRIIRNLVPILIIPDR